MYSSENCYQKRTKKQPIEFSYNDLGKCTNSLTKYPLSETDAKRNSQGALPSCTALSNKKFLLIHKS
jgi:hypothetical protein